MGTLLVAVGAAAFLVMSALLSLSELRFRGASALQEAADPAQAQPSESKFELPITSRWARCECGEARERHPGGRCDGCACPRFAYAGGLIMPAPRSGD